MARSKYREERTMSCGFRRLPGQDRAEFRKNVKTLRGYVERYNVDVSEICQWLMGFRPSDDESNVRFGPFWERILNPEPERDGLTEREINRIRLEVFDLAFGLKKQSDLLALLAPFPQELQTSINHVLSEPRTRTAQRLFARMAQVGDSHRALLVKSATEWIVERYYNKINIWKRQHEEWLEEKKAWEGGHPELTEEIREAYNAIFKDMKIRLKNPRVCSWEHLAKNADNCLYAGEPGKLTIRHAQLCVKYRDFAKSCFQGKNSRYKNRFSENVAEYLNIRRSRPVLTQSQAMEELFKKVKPARGWFADAWKQYLIHMNLSEDNLIKKGITHCWNIKGDQDCEYNKHTDYCVQYKERLQKLAPEYLKLEGQYREWRRDFLSGPRKPAFKYPSGRNLTIPKIFGAGYYEIDFTNSVLKLRFDGMPEGQFVAYGFKPWPADYDKQPADIEISSASVHFVGTRAKADFRFKVRHKQSRFGVSQDEIDRLRSREYPRRAQDNEFLDEVRKRLLKNFDGNPEKDMRIMAVDLGSGGAGFAIFSGKKFVDSHALKIIKIDKLYEKGTEKSVKGLGIGHVKGHLDSFAKSASKITKTRNEKKKEDENKDGFSNISVHDMRRLSLHVRFMLRDWARLNAAQAVRIAERENIDLLIFESQRGFISSGYDENDLDNLVKKRRMAFFAYGSIRRKVTEKAVERGMRVVTVPYLYSSHVCAKCGKKQENVGLWRKNKGKRFFECEDRKCGNKIGSDENAARVLGRVFWGEIHLPSVKSDLT